jgi:hypothetical protein
MLSPPQVTYVFWQIFQPTAATLTLYEKLRGVAMKILFL